MELNSLKQVLRDREGPSVYSSSPRDVGGGTPKSVLHDHLLSLNTLGPQRERLLILSRGGPLLSSSQSERPRPLGSAGQAHGNERQQCAAVGVGGSVPARSYCIWSVTSLWGMSQGGRLSCSLPEGAPGRKWVREARGWGTLLKSCTH